MIQLYRMLAARFDVLSTRERMMLLGGALVLAFGLFDFLALQPLAIKHKRLTQQLEETRNTLRTTDAAIQAIETQDPATQKRAQRDDLRRQIAAFDEKMQGLQKSLVPPDQMAKLLEGMLARSRGLSLVSLRKLPVRRFESQAAATPADPAAAAASPTDRGIFQHTFEFSVQGSYADLHDYLAKLEKLPWQMFWGGVKLSSEDQPRLTLTLTVHTLSLNKAWLIV